MIKNPHYISKTGKTIPIVLGKKVDPFNRKDPLCSQVWYEGIVGVRWEDEKSVIQFSPLNIKAIDAYPTPDMKNFVVLLYGENAGYPNNAIFLNDKGDTIVRPSVPERLSKKDKWLPKGDLEYFDGCGWSQYDDYLYFYFPIGESDFRETRFFNYRTMEWNLERYETWRL